MKRTIRMRINEIFYSIQGEGFFTGTPAIFIRFSGCNLKCPFCDTPHQEFTEMTEAEVLQAIAKYPCKHVVLTGGEPSLQVTHSFIDLLHRSGKFIQMETNGTFPISYGIGIDWVTCSPKNEFCSHAEIKLQHVDELKVVFDGRNDIRSYDGIHAIYYYLQPCDTLECQKANVLERTVHFCMKHPKWRISLQTQKIMNIQ